MKFAKVVKWIVVIAIPFLLTLATVWFLISWNSPSYPEFEYGRIQSDRYGFTDEERLDLATQTLTYLRRSEPADEVIFLLVDLRLPGTDNPLYNEREISHMVDVKHMVDLFKTLLWVFTILVGAGMVFLLYRPDTRLEGYRASFHGGLLTTGILIIMLILIVIAWSTVFTQFHELLFPPDTWTFFYTDSLIRLFPEQFWFDFGLIWAGLIFVEGLILAIVGYFLVRSANN